MKRFLNIILIFSIYSVAVFAQDSLPRVVSVPKITVPAEAVKSGLGGKVSVRIKVDKTGAVLSADNMSGPDWVCPTVQRADVLALRQAARDVALQTKFEPALKRGKPITETISMNFDFPRMKDVETTVKESAEKTADNDLNPKDLEGLRINAGVVNGKATKMPRPGYPVEAAMARVEGPVVVTVMIDFNGDVFAAKPKSGHQMLLRSATQAACGAKFSRTTLGGKPVNVTGDITYVFSGSR